MNTVYNISDNITLKSGGLRTAVLSLDKFINSNQKFKSKIITNNKEISDDFIEFKSEYPWKYNKDFKNYLKKNITREDKIHLHGVFMFCQYYASKFSIKNDIPFLITPHGMLEPWHLNDKKIKKSIYMRLFLNNMLNKSSYIHCITPLEKENIFKLTNKKNIFEIPNLLHFNAIPDINNYNPNQEYFLFLGRIHPKKGLDLLIEALDKIDNKTIKLKILGNENDYSISLKEKYKNSTVFNRLEFVGPVYGDEKYSYFANAKAFVAPSYSEAIGIVNLEAAACKTPVITTNNTGLNPLWNNEGGLLINPEINELINALNIACSWDNNERKDRGIKLHDFVYNNYSWETKGYLWEQLYNII